MVVGEYGVRTHIVLSIDVSDAALAVRGGNKAANQTLLEALLEKKFVI